MIRALVKKVLVFAGCHGLSPALVGWLIARLGLRGA